MKRDLAGTQTSKDMVGYALTMSNGYYHAYPVYADNRQAIWTLAEGFNKRRVMKQARKMVVKFRREHDESVAFGEEYHAVYPGAGVMFL